MVYKLANVADMDMLPQLEQKTWDILYEYTSVLTNEYGASRNVDTDDGGYVLYATPGAAAEEIKERFDFSTAELEYVNRYPWTSPPICGAMYILHNEYVVVIVMSIADAPAEFVEAFEEGH